MIYSQGVVNQVGINTETPRARLDVQGNLSVRNRIYLGGSDTVNGLLGDVGTVLVSQGVNNPPVWKLIRRPDFDPFLYTIFNNEAKETINGIIFAANSAGAGSQLHILDQTLTSFAGTEITELERTFQIDNSGNIAILTFETIAHLESTNVNRAADFSCGVFVDNLLKGIRVYTLNQPGAATYPFYTFDLVAAAPNLTVGSHTAKVACKKRANINGFTGQLGIGKSIPAGGNLNDFMTKSSLVVETYEKPSSSNTVTVYNP
ncbi:hypothetical protein MQX03_13830 [Chryseobacterium aahli]|uniref:hypothetical protein n=1 Tax=Chryseobacterium aahli TaxID=1278643 RepID=UPI001F6180B6|nr:hypothetical protein [Chryseobacterium aahli]MCI3938278.1 hypothetical protein [Chryseobacterium aahli]